MDKYFIGTGTIDGRKRRTGHILANFRGDVETAAGIIARVNPGIEDLEVTENGDSETGMIEPMPGADAAEDFAPAMMKPPRTVKAQPSKVTPAGPAFKPATGKLPGQE